MSQPPTVGHNDAREPDSDRGRPARHTTAQRIRFLIDYAKAVDGRDITYTDIRHFLTERGIALSRARWSYLVNGHREVADDDLYAGLADYFEVDADYLRGTQQRPKALEANLDTVLNIRIERVRNYARHNLEDVAPQTLDAVNEALDEKPLAT